MTHRLFTTVLLALALIAGVANSSLAAGRAASHAGGVVTAAPPCHRAAAADTLASLAVDPCDTLCAGSTPELTQDQPPNPDLVIAVALIVTPEIQHRAGTIAAPRPAHHHPPPIPQYQRDRRLLI